MRDRDEIVNLLQGRGFTAFQRTWAMGETVFVSHEKCRMEVSGTKLDGLALFQDAVFIKENKDGTWVVTASAREDETLPDFAALLSHLEKRFGVSV